ncbi:MAG: aldo/keto reductase family oxidoreductase, partial [Streptococcus salivarius]
VLRYPGKMQAVIGTTKPQHVLEAGKAAEVILTRKEWYQIYLAAGNDLP